MSKEDFIKSLQVPPNTADQALVYLQDGVLAMNESLGLNDSPVEEMKDFYYKLTIAEIQELEEAVALQDPHALVKELVDVFVTGFYYTYLSSGELIHDVSRIGEGRLPKTSRVEMLHIEVGGAIDFFHSLYIDHMLAVTEVMESNLSKIPTMNELCNAFRDGFSEEEILQKQIEILEEGGRYRGVYYEHITVQDEERVVFWCTSEYGVPVKKYLKPVTYKEADMSEVIL